MHIVRISIYIMLINFCQHVVLQVVYLLHSNLYIKKPSVSYTHFLQSYSTFCDKIQWIRNDFLGPMKLCPSIGELKFLCLPTPHPQHPFWKIHQPLQFFPPLPSVDVEDSFSTMTRDEFSDETPRRDWRTQEFNSWISKDFRGTKMK